MKARLVCALTVVLLVACGDDDGSGPMDAGPEPDRVTTPVPPSPRMDAMPEASMDAGPRDAGPTRPDLGPLDAGPGLGMPVCDPRDPAACPEGESCRALYGSTGLQFTCRFGGSVTEGEPCGFALSGFSGAFFTDDCVGGLWCTAEGPGSGNVCRPLCGGPGDCDTGETCRLVARGVPPFPFAGVCFAQSTCDATTGTGCPSGETCHAAPDVELVFGTYCDPVGPLVEGEICSNSEVCGSGLGCSIVPREEGGFDPPMPGARYFVPSRCQALCDPTDASSDVCSEGTTGCVATAPSADPPVASGLCRLPDPDPIGPPDRPAHVIVPASYDGSTEVPLVVALHGFTSSGVATDQVLRIRRQANRDGFLAVTPDGLRNPDNVPYWNVAPVACTTDCPDDVAYILGLIDEMKTTYRVDANRVYVTGISNGAYMSYRLACDGAGVITAIASMAGADVLDETDCTPSRPVSVLEIHGDEDSNVPYGGSMTSLGTIESIERWAARDGCDVSMATMGTPFDVDTMLEGNETTVRTFSTGCMPGVDAELWTVVGADHFFFGQLADDYFDRVMTWLLRHSR